MSEGADTSAGRGRAPRSRPGGWLRPMTAALLRQRRRLLLATIAIALSVGYLAGALSLLDRVGRGLDELAGSGAGRADLVVEGGVAYESPIEQVRRLVPDSVSASIAAIPGVAAVSPRIEDTAPIVGPDGDTLVALGLTEQPVGANYPDDPKLSAYRFAEGRAPTSDTEVAIDQRSATEGGVGVGDTVTVVGRAGAAPYSVVGIVGSDGSGLPPGSSLALLTTDEARRRFARPTDDNTIDVRLEPGADRDRVASEIGAVLPAGIDVVDSATAAEHRQEGLNRSFALVRSLILGFAGLALIVGMVTVGNSLALLYAERRRTFAGLRLVGAKPRQLLFGALTEAALLALLASVIGAPLGLLLGRVIEAALGALNTSVPVAGSSVSLGALVWAVVIGVVATVLAAVIPAWRACRVPPIEAVQSSGAPRPRTVGQSIVTVVVVAVVVGLAAALLVSRGEGGMDPVTLGLGTAAAVVVLGLLPLGLSALVSTVVRVVPLRPSALRRIAARDVGRHRSRTAATAAALILATAVVSGLAVFLTSFTASVDGQVRDVVGADLVVDSGTFTKGGLPEDLVTQLAELPVVSSASGWEVGRGDVGATPVRMTGFDMTQLTTLVHPGWVGAEPTGLTAESVVVSSRLADALSLSVGGQLPLTFTSGGVETLQIGGIYASGDLLLGDAVVDRSIVRRQVPATADIAALLKLDPNDAASRAQVVALAKRSGVTSVLAPESFVQQRADVLRGFERVIEWMLLFTLVQALIGVVNTLLLSVGERRRQLGLLRASGASRRQVVRMVLVEGIALAVVGTVVGLVVGLAGARLGIMSVSSLGLDSFEIPFGMLAVVGVAAALLGIVATAAPAIWASGVPPLEAVFDDGDLRSRPRRAQRPRLHRFGRVGFHWTEAADAITDEAVSPGAWVAEATASAAALHPTSQHPAPQEVPPPFPSTIAVPPLPGAASPAAEPQPVPVQPAAPEAPAPEPVVAEPVVAEPAVPEPAVPEPAETQPRPIEAPTPADVPDAVPDEVPVVEPLEEPLEEPVWRPAAGPRRRARWSPARTTRRRRARGEPTIADGEPVAETGDAAEVGHTTETGDTPERTGPFGVQGATGRARSGDDAEAWTTEAPTGHDRGERSNRPSFGVGSAPSGPPPTAERPTGPFRPAGAPGGPRTPAGAGAGRGSGAGAGAGRSWGAGAFGSDNASFEQAIGRLHPATPGQAPNALRIAAESLVTGEVVDRLVTGRAKGLNCVLVRTDRRLLVVAERPGAPVVESLHPGRTSVTVTPEGGGTVVVSVSDGRRVMRLLGVREVAEAERLAHAHAAAPTYF